MEKAIILISGGTDSVLTAEIARQRGYELYFLTANYGQKNFKREEKNSKFFAKYFKAKEHKIIDITWLGKLGNSAATDANMNFDGIHKEFEYIPFRNTVLISVAVAWAEVNGATHILTGSMAGPWICPDNSPEYYKAIQNLINIATKTNKNITIEAPLNELNKSQIIKKSMEFNLPLDHTFTCIGGHIKACGKCPPCLNRLEAFKILNLQDVIKYNKEK